LTTPARSPNVTPVTPIPFRVNPAFVTLGEAIELTIAHMRANLALWLVPTAIYTLVAGALTWAVTDAFLGQLLQYRYDAASAEAMAQTVLDNLPGLVGFVLLLVIGGLALYWIAMALAIGGLPARQMTPDRAIGAGLRTIVLGILYFVVAVPVMIALVAFGLVAGDAAIWLLLLFIPAVMFGFAFVAIRLSFALYAIFDGVGIADSVRLSWSISRGAMLRILGWLVALGAISFGISIATGLAGSAFAAAPLIGTLFSTLLTTAFQFFTAIVLAILYESQRMRHVYASPGTVLPGGPVWAPPAIEPGAPGDPLVPPPPPAW
jgi:hypothetical protein